MWENLQGYQASLSKSLFPSRLTMNDPWCDFRARSVNRGFGMLSMIKAHANAAFTLERLAAEDRRADRFVLHLQTTGQSAYMHKGGEVFCPAKTLLLVDVQNVLLAEQRSPADAIVIKIPGQFIRGQIRQVEDFCWNPVAADQGAADILRNFMLNTWAWGDKLDGHEGRMLALSMFSLIESVFHQSAAGQGAAREQESFYRRLRQEIADRLDEPALTVDDLARAMGVSRSSLYRLTSYAGMTIGQVIIDVRLEHVARELLKPHRQDATLTELAFEAGFRDLSHFSRRFKQRFGKSPSDYRATAGHAAPEPGGIPS